MKVCEYGCEQKAQYEMSSGKWCCSPNYQACNKNKVSNSEGLRKAYREGRRLSGSERYKLLSEETKENMNWSKGKTKLSDPRIKSNYDPSKLFIMDGEILSEGYLRKIILTENLLEYKCQECRLDPFWNNKELMLDLDHINGDRKDNRLENLRFLCPNCHSQTSTFRGRNIKKKEHKTDEEFIEAINNSSNSRQALLYLGLAPKGGNYKTLYERMIKLNLRFN